LNLVFLNQTAQLGQIDKPITSEARFLKKGVLSNRPAMLKIMEIISIDLNDLFTTPIPEKDKW
jgi:hypothetical protein